MSKDPFVFYTIDGHKQIRNKHGCVLMEYPDIPKNIEFKHQAINDYNQHLCGAWTVYNHYDFEEVDRVVAGLKPLGWCGTRNLVELKKRIKDNRDKGYLVSVIKNKFIKGVYNITISPSCKLKDYFDMDVLANDYARNGLSTKNIELYKEVNFSAFHYDKFNVKYHPIEIVGLILGYPIENTISLMKNKKIDM